MACKPCGASIWMEDTFDMVNRFFHRIKSSLVEGYHKLLPIFSGTSKISSKLHEPDNLSRSFSGSGEARNVKESQLTPKEQTKGDGQCDKSSMRLADHIGLVDLEEEEKASEYSGEKQQDPSFLALARKMKELEMMDVSDGDHVLDIEEVIHYYSLLTCPIYLEIVDKFFMDMYLELHLAQSRSVNNSMRKLGSASVHGSMRNLVPQPSSVHSSMRKLGSPSLQSSMRSLGPVKI